MTFQPSHPRVQFDSKKVQPGDIYVAIMGEKYNGEDFIDEAIDKGASQIILSSSAYANKREGVEYHVVDNPRKTLSHLAAKCYELQPKNIIGVTGTSGKTSTVGFVRQLIEHVNLKAASIGTLGVITNDLEFESLDTMTSPDPLTLHSVLQALANENIHNVAIEVSSHGLAQYRLESVTFKAGAFTNFSQDHLDYHKTLETYFKTKLRFFEELLPSGAYAILNKDIKEFDQLYNICKKRSLRPITFGKKDADITCSLTDNQLILRIFDDQFETFFPFNAEFQQYNLLCALGLIAAINIDIRNVIPFIPKLLPAIGRLEKVGEYNRAQVFIDYAHKPDALEKVLISARKFTRGRLHIMFGCGGDRDSLKRPIMGGIAARLADRVIITDDNPRNEDPHIIRKEILQNAPNAIEIENRRSAIRYAVTSLEDGDTLIVAGKGHEDYQMIGNIKYRFSDFEEVKKILSPPLPE